MGLLFSEPFIIAECIALVTSIICAKWLYKTPCFVFVPYMLMTVLAEASGSYFGEIHHESKDLSPILLQLFPNYFRQHRPADTNVLVFNFSLTIEYLVFYYIYYVNIQKAIFKKLMIAVSIIFLTFAIADLLFIHGPFIYNSTKMLVGTIGIVLAEFFYLYDAFEHNKPIKLLRQPMFWISTGIFFFYLGDFTFDMMFDYLRSKNLLMHSHVFVLINHNLIIFEYLCIAAGLIMFSRNKPKASRLREQA